MIAYLLEGELTVPESSHKNTLKVKFNNKVYIRVKTLPKKFYEQAQKIQEEYTAKQQDSLLIEHKNWIAVWLEELNELDEIENDYLYRAKDSCSNVEDEKSPLKNVQGISYLDYKKFFSPQKSAKQPIVKKYRGVTYEDNALNISYPIIQAQQSSKKYRGVAYKSTVSNNMTSNSSQTEVSSVE